MTWHLCIKVNENDINFSSLRRDYNDIFNDGLFTRGPFPCELAATEEAAKIVTEGLWLTPKSKDSFTYLISPNLIEYVCIGLVK